ncbi:hypothetical protein [Paenibacillus sp. MMS20-IR301]|uniref:hypothetical protein n=1 Tax=Paenibacillus sp. MMS20-IR301 TaxID=2895946 RepID=UPI0028EB3F5B|nr:hypothetical protein [Paenibacillus sp. MMS20-IR301]WNS44264.1 hypothetical protein LOS79_03055 [Paenibacillus sp. MMS20-IR301]
MANNSDNYGYNPAGNNSGGKNAGSGSSSNTAESEELSAEDYAIIAAGFGVLGELFGFLSLVKAKQVTKATGGEIGIDPVLFVQARKKAAKRRSRPPRKY